jgi:UDP-GlcNAc:undecaprenyl-phosphate GlcNAc-1-phosphate transferase
MAFVAAAAIALLTTPLFRQLAQRVGLVDQPATYKTQTFPVPYLGGLAIALGTLAGIALAPGQGVRVGAVALIAVALCVVGLLDDDRQLAPTPRLAVEVTAAVATFALGLRFEVTGIGTVDGGLTVLWIVGLTNATNLLDNMDGLGAGVAASIAVSSLFLMLAGDAWPVAVMAAAVVGACLGFLAYNKRPASIYMGDAGSLFLGYLLAVITLAATQTLSAGHRLVVPLMLAAIPVADTTTVVMARLRRGISPVQAGNDHLSHRLVRRGLSPGPAVAVLVTASLLMGLLGSLAGRGSLPLSASLAAAAVVLGLLLGAALPVPVYDTPVTGLPARVRMVGAAGIVGAVLAWQTGLIPIGDLGPSVPFHPGSAGLSPPLLILLGAGFAVLGTTLLVVARQRRQAVPRVLPDDLLIRQLKDA